MGVGLQLHVLYSHATSDKFLKLRTGYVFTFPLIAHSEMASRLLESTGDLLDNRIDECYNKLHGDSTEPYR